MYTNNNNGFFKSLTCLRKSRQCAVCCADAFEGQLQVVVVLQLPMVAQFFGADSFFEGFQQMCGYAGM
jgi:hypothetical protein